MDEGTVRCTECHRQVDEFVAVLLHERVAMTAIAALLGLDNIHLARSATVDLVATTKLGDAELQSLAPPTSIPTVFTNCP